MIKSDELLLMSYLSKEPSIAAVGRRMFLTPSAISQKLSALEKKLGQKLAERNGRSGITLTADGEFLASRGMEILWDLELVQDQMNDRKGVISGTVTVVAPFGFGRTHISPALAAFSKRHPKLSIGLRLSDDLSRVPENTWDILIRISPPKETSFDCHNISNNRRLLCASPEYLEQNGALNCPNDLLHHRCISISEDGLKGGDWVFTARNGAEKVVKVIPHYTTNDGETALAWALSGLGVIVRSEWSASSLINSGNLVELLPNWSSPDAPIVALTSNRNAQSVRVQAVLNHLIDGLNL